MNNPVALITPALLTLLVVGCSDPADPAPEADTDSATDGGSDDTGANPTTAPATDSASESDSAAATDTAPDTDTAPEDDSDTGSDTDPDGDSSSDDSSVEDTGGSDSEGGSTDDGVPCVTANPPTMLSLDGDGFPRSAPASEWNAPLPGCADTVDYEAAIGSAAGLDDVMAFTSIGGSPQWDGAASAGVYLEQDSTNFVSIRAVDADGNVSTSISQSFQIWNPSELPGLALWIDFADSSTVFADEACTVGANNGNEIRCVTDKSGSGNDFGPTISYPGPSYQTGAFGGLGAASFSGNVALVAEDSPSLSPGLSMTIVSVEAPASVSASNITAYGYVLQKDDAYQLAYFNGQFNAAVNTTAAGSWGWNNGGVAAFAQAQCNTFMHNNDQWTFRRDGTLIANVSPGNGQNGAISDNFEPVYIGARIDGGNTSFGYNGLTSEILMVTAALDAAQIADAERYMLEKWGL